MFNIIKLFISSFNFHYKQKKICLHLFHVKLRDRFSGLRTIELILRENQTIARGCHVLANNSFKLQTVPFTVNSEREVCVKIRNFVL